MTAPARTTADGATRRTRRAPGRLRRRWAGMSLRGRLVAAVIALLALICLIVGVVTNLVLRQYLIQQVDSRVAAAVQRGQDPGDENGDGGQFRPPSAPQPGTFDAMRQMSGLVTAQGQDGVWYGTYLVDSGSPTQTTRAQNAVVATVPTDGTPVTRVLPGLGTYRLIALGSADGRRVSVAGLPMSDVNDILLRLTLTEICVALAGMIAVGLVGESVITRTLRPLRRVAATATRVSEMTLDRGEVALSVRVPERDTDPRTEVGQVGASLNKLLGHVATALSARQASETRVRQFVADASHELRTPLAAIRGYAELTRRTDEPVPEDVAYAMGRVESESARMTTLVDDLLLLARLDSGRPLEHDRLDLSRLVVDAVSDAHVAGPDHDWRLDVPEEPLQVSGDAARLHQVLANLLANARTHTPAGTTVAVALTPGPDGSARLVVADDGPGIPAALLPDVFERFARGDSSRSRAAGSTGLGLAIVAAVVEAHGGTVTVDSVPGRTAFTVTLPAAPPDDAGGPPGRDRTAAGPTAEPADDGPAGDPDSAGATPPAATGDLAGVRRR
jgi:two-component system OmpR family sensor kinase